MGVLCDLGVSQIVLNSTKFDWNFVHDIAMRTTPFVNHIIPLQEYANLSYIPYMTEFPIALKNDLLLKWFIALPDHLLAGPTPTWVYSQIIFVVTIYFLSICKKQHSNLKRIFFIYIIRLTADKIVGHFFGLSYLNISGNNQVENSFFRISNIPVPCPHAQLRGRTVIKKLWTFFRPWGRDLSQSPPCWIFRVKQIHRSTASERTTRLSINVHFA